MPDDVWNDAAAQYDERQLAALLFWIAITNVWNRINVATRQIAGEWMKLAEARSWVEKKAAAK